MEIRREDDSSTGCFAAGEWRRPGRQQGPRDVFFKLGCVCDMRVGDVERIQNSSASREGMGIH